MGNRQRAQATPAVLAILRLRKFGFSVIWTVHSKKFPPKTLGQSEPPTGRYKANNFRMFKSLSKPGKLLLAP